jgi:predicted DNA-binding transcriptional regulator YafY
MAQVKLRELLRLTTELQASSYGLTYEQIRDRLGHAGHRPSLRSVQRMMETLRVDLDMDVKEWVLDADHHLTKRFRIDNLPSAALALDTGETAELKRHLATLPDGLLSQALTKVIAGANQLSGNIKAQLDELIERTAYTASFSPRSAISKDKMSLIEKAIEGRTQLKFNYRAKKASTTAIRSVKPLGLLFGRFGYLCAAAGTRDAAIYRLDLLEDVEATDISFEPKIGWDFKQWASESFGVYHGDELINVKLRFSKAIASRAEKITFHHSQKITRGRSGSLVIELRCRGHRELIWEMLHPDWLGEVKIEQPTQLRDEYRAQLEKAKSAVAV